MLDNRQNTETQRGVKFHLCNVRHKSVPHNETMGQTRGRDSSRHAGNSRYVWRLARDCGQDTAGDRGAVSGP